MCGRFVLSSSYPELAKALRMPLEVGEADPRYNVAPGTWIRALRGRDEDSPMVLDEVWWTTGPTGLTRKLPSRSTLPK